MRARILGLPFDPVTPAQAVERVASYINEGTPHQVVTLNPEMAYQAWSDPRLAQLIERAALVTPDGEGIVWAARTLRQPVRERVTGIDLAWTLAREASRRGWRLYLYGAAPGVAEAAAGNLGDKFPGLMVVGTAHGYLTEAEQEQLLIDIREKKPHLLLVGLGAPRQEFWIAARIGQLGVPVAMGVGGSLDVLAGRAKRAPALFRRLRLEWLYRILREPKRLKRALVLPRFAWRVWRARGRA